MIAIVRDAALMTGIGIVVGLAGGLYLSRFVKGLLHEVYPTDAFSIVLPIGCLLLAAFLAGTRRQARVPARSRRSAAIGMYRQWLPVAATATSSFPTALKGS